MYRQSKKTTSVDRQIGARLKAARRAKRMDPEELASAIGVSVSTYYAYERGRSRLFLGPLVQLATLLSVSPADLFPECSDGQP